MKVRPRWRAGHGRFLTRVLAGMLVVSLPVTIALAVLLTQKSSSSLARSAETRSEQTARADRVASGGLHLRAPSRT